MPAAPEPLRLRSTRSYRHLAPPVSPRHTLAALPAERDACNPLCINQLVFFNPVLRPFGLEERLILALFLRAGDRHEIRTDAPAVNDFVGDPFVAEHEMAAGFVKRGVDDRIFDDNLAHAATFFDCASIAWVSAATN